MSKAASAPSHEPSKRELQSQMEQTRESLAETVGEIKETVEQQYAAVKQTVSGVLDYREQFKDEPLVWSLGALSAGFALGYTVGYAHKNTKGGKQSQLVKFADGMVEDLSAVGQNMVIPALTVKIKELFGFDFSDMLRDMGNTKTVKKKRKSPARRKALTSKSRTKTKK
ncbi:MAG TPA: DUF3618 domain-containing protein [Pyrinomonadaceae bacterium]|nr:DUF3618 domain-containing protein [Pyrinomonadaceae bacterium]